MNKIFIISLLMMLISCNTNKKLDVRNIQRNWMLIEFKEFTKEYLVEKKAYLNLSNDKNASAKMGCNNLGFSYEILNKNQIEFKEGFATRMACQDMKLEYEFLSQLPLIKNYEIEGQKLILIGNDGLKMVFVAQDWD